MLINARGEKHLDRRSLRWIVRRLASLYNLDLAAIRNNYGPLLGRKRYLPIPFTYKLIYLPLSLKAATIPPAARLGYISLKDIAGFKANPELNVIILQSGFELFCLNAPATIERRIRDGRLLQKIMRGEQLKGENLYHLAKESLSLVAEKRCGTEEIARFTANLLHYLTKNL